MYDEWASQTSQLEGDISLLTWADPMPWDALTGADQAGREDLLNLLLDELQPGKSGVDDWSRPLREDWVDDVIVNPPPPPPPNNPGEYYDPNDWGGWDGHNTDQREPPPPPEPCRSFLQAPNPEGGDYKIPPNFNIIDLIAAGNTIDSIPVTGIGLKLVQFKEFVGPGGPFDYKVQTNQRETYTQADGTIGTRSIYDPIGNWAYGFIAEIANIEFAAFYAWLNEQIDGDGVGEDPIDQMHITAGYEAAKRYKETGALPQERNIYCGS